MLGRRRDCEQALAAAETEFGRIEPGDPAIELFSPTQPGRLAGSRYLSLSDADTAVTFLEQTVPALQDQSKAQAVALANLALAYIRQGRRDAAVARLHEAIDVTERTRGGGGLNVIFGAGRELRQWRTRLYPGLRWRRRSRRPAGPTSRLAGRTGGQDRPRPGAASRTRTCAAERQAPVYGGAEACR